MLKAVRNAKESDLEFIRRKQSSHDNLMKYASKAGSLEMFRLLIKNGFVGPTLFSELLEKEKFEFVKDVLKDGDFHPHKWNVFQNSDQLIQCLPYSLKIFDWPNYPHFELIESFVLSAIEQGKFEPKFLTATLAINESVFKIARENLEVVKNYEPIKYISSDCLKYISNDQLNSQLTDQFKDSLKKYFSHESTGEAGTIYVFETKDLLDLKKDDFDAYRLYFMTTEIPDEEIMENLNPSVVVNPYYLLKYSTPTHYRWENADWEFISTNNFEPGTTIDAWFPAKDTPKTRLGKIQSILRYCKNGAKEELENYNQNLTEEDLLYYELKGHNCPAHIIFCLINHPRILRIITSRRMDAYINTKQAFKFANWDLIGPYLKYIPFTMQKMEEIVQLNMGLYIYKNAAIMYKPIRNKSARK